MKTLPLQPGDRFWAVLVLWALASFPCSAAPGWVDKEVSVDIPVGEVSASFGVRVANDSATPVTLDAVLPECSCISVGGHPSVLAPGETGTVRLVFSLGSGDVSVQKVLLMLGDGSRSILKVKAARDVPVMIYPRVVALTDQDQQPIIRVTARRADKIAGLVLSCGARSVRSDAAQAGSTVAMAVPLTILPARQRHSLVKVAAALSDGAFYEETIVVYDRRTWR